MNILKKFAAVTGTALVLLAIPALAQAGKVITFNAPFAFQAGDVTMPAGTYTVTQPDDNIPVLQIEDADGSHSAFITYRPVAQDTVSTETLASFNRYGDVDFLSQIYVRGASLRIVIPQSQAEEAAAVVAEAREHSLPATDAAAQPTATSEPEPINGSN